MAQMQMKLGGLHGLAALVVVVVVAVRLATLGESTDEELHGAIRAELRNELGNRLGKVLEGADPASEKSVAEVLEHADESRIVVHSVRVSKPLLSWSSKEEAIVRVEYSLPGVERRAEFWRFDHRLVGGWRYQDGEKAIHGFFTDAARRARSSSGSHFQRLTAAENGTTSLSCNRPPKNSRFSPACYRFDSTVVSYYLNVL